MSTNFIHIKTSNGKEYIVNTDAIQHVKAYNDNGREYCVMRCADIDLIVSVPLGDFIRALMPSAKIGFD